MRKSALRSALSVASLATRLRGQPLNALQSEIAGLPRLGGFAPAPAVDFAIPFVHPVFAKGQSCQGNW